MAIEALEGVTDEELFNQANADEAPADEAVVEAAEEPAEQVEQPRDEAGRFAEKPADEPVTVTATDPPAPPPVDDNTAMIPSFRLKQEADARRQLETDLANERAERAALRQRLEALERPAPKVDQPKVDQPKAEKPDPLLDPEGYEAYLEKKFEEKQLNNSREFDLRLTRQSNTELFDKAYGESQRLKQAGDPDFMELAQKLQQTNAPGQALLDWYQQRTIRAEVGSDPNAFFQKRLDAWLADPANQAKVIEKARGAAQPQPGAPRQAAPVNLPPSLTRAASAATIDADDNDVSDEGLWRHANA